MSGPRILGGIAVGVAAGTLLGFYVLAPNVEGGPAGTDASVEAELDSARDEVAASAGELRADDAVLDGLAEDAVRGALRDRSVLIVTVGGVRDDLVDHQRGLLSAAGASDAGTLRLSGDAVSQDKADAVKSLAANSLPAGAKLSEERRDPGFHLGQLLGQALRTAGEGDRPKEASDSDRGLVLGALDKAGLLDGGIPELESADGVIVLTDANGGYAGTFAADLAAGIDDTTGGVVLGGDRRTARDGGAVAVLRADRADNEKVSTVDNADRVAGEITVVKALAAQLGGRAGSYGAADSAAAPTL